MLIYVLQGPVVVSIQTFCCIQTKKYTLLASCAVCWCTVCAPEATVKPMLLQWNSKGFKHCQDKSIQYHIILQCDDSLHNQLYMLGVFSGEEAELVSQGNPSAGAQAAQANPPPAAAAPQAGQQAEEEEPPPPEPFGQSPAAVCFVLLLRHGLLLLLFLLSQSS